MNREPTTGEFFAAPPMAAPRAVGPIFRNWRPYVPTWAKGWVATDCDGNAATTSAAATPWMNLDLTLPTS